MCRLEKRCLHAFRSLNECKDLVVPAVREMCFAIVFAKLLWFSTYIIMAFYQKFPTAMGAVTIFQHLASQ